MEPTTIEGAIAYLLSTDPGVAALVGDRIHSMSTPQSVPRPKLTFWRWGTERSSENGGFTNDGPTGFATAKIFVDAWADDLLTAKQIAAAARRALDGFSGLAGTFVIGSIHTVDEREQPGQLIEGQNTAIQRQTLDLRVSFQDQ